MIDILASKPQYVEHLRPVREALDARGLHGSLGPTAGGGDGPIVVASGWDHKTARRYKGRPVVVMEHGIGQSYSNDSWGYPGGASRAADLYLTPNHHSADRWRATYPDADVRVVGSPRLDRLPHRDTGPTTVAVSFHWPCKVAIESGSAFDHFASALRTLARRVRLIGHFHPLWARMGDDRPRKLYEELGIEVVTSFEDVCRRADAYVCDNSSTIYEFASTGRPVVVLNAPEWRRDVEHGLRFWEAADVGVQVDEPERLYHAVSEALEDPLTRLWRREKALAVVYPVRTGAAALAAAAIVERFPVRVAA